MRQSHEQEEGGEEREMKEQEQRVQSMNRAVLSEELQRHKHKGDLGNSTRNGRCGNVVVRCWGGGAESFK